MQLTATIMRALAVALLATLLAGCAEPPYQNVDNAGLEQLIEQGVPVVDIRRPDEWQQTGVVAGSQRMTFVDEVGRLKPGFLEHFSRRFDPDQPVVLICRTGNRTDALARHLMEHMGYTRVYNVRNGINRWIRQGKPVARG